LVARLLREQQAVPTGCARGATAVEIGMQVSHRCAMLADLRHGLGEVLAGNFAERHAVSDTNDFLDDLDRKLAETEVLKGYRAVDGFVTGD
jgi:hypothetical protein